MEFFFMLYCGEFGVVLHEVVTQWTLGLCYNPACLCPGGIGPSFLERSGFGPDCLGPLERPSFCPTDLSRGICGMCHGLAYIILLYPRFGHNLTFICSDLSDPYVLFLEPHFCFISYVRPLCFSVVHLLCTIFIFCFPFQVTHSNHSSISMHVIFYWFFSTEINLDKLLLLFCLIF